MYLNHVRYGTTDADTVNRKPVGCMVSSRSAETRWWTQLQKKVLSEEKKIQYFFGNKTLFIPKKTDPKRHWYWQILFT